MTTVQQPNPASTEELTYCEVHPDRETALRCNKCGRYMCPDCAVQTPVGYRCRQCVRQHEDKFYKGTQSDDVKVFAVCAGLMAVAGGIMSAVGFGLFLALIVGFPVGGGISELALRAIQRRRGRYSGQIAAAGAVVGGLVGAMLQVYFRYNSMLAAMASERGAAGADLPGLSIDFLLQMVVSDIGLLLFIGIVAATVYGRFKMRM